MDKGRFSLLLLDPGEIYFEDFSAILITPDITSKTYDFKKQEGRLKLCSKSVVFDPKDIAKPLIKIPLKECQIIEKWKGKSKFIKSENVLSIISRKHIEMLEGNVIAPYKFCDDGRFLFLLNYSNIADCVSQISQLQRASTLPAAEQANMIAAIVHSRHARVTFNPLWLDLYEKVVMEIQADKITPLVVNPGRIILSTARLYFQPYNNIETCALLKINLSCIKRIVKRRFLLRHIGLEIYSNKSDKIAEIYIALSSQKERDDLYSGILAQPDLHLDNTERDVMTLRWQNGVVSNYDYLLYINSLGDRTINDLTQYPVFPWTISDYTSATLNLNDLKSFRDLSKPIGALNKNRLEKLLARYEEMSQPKFLYGSHYSTPGFVLFYLVRLYPHYMLCLQNGRFDMPDRMFNSCADVYKNCLNNISDFKELVPQFYDTDDEGKFLINELGINFGYRESGVKVGDVFLPPWAKSPKHFVTKLREALESDIVSQTLHLWIDLIFGYKQRGEEAEKAHNVFHYMCYEGYVDLDSIKDINQRHPLEVQIMEFGQVPRQVFNVPHPQRKVGQILLEPLQISSDEEEKNCDIWKNFTSLIGCASFMTHKGAINSLFITSDSDKVVSVGHDSKMKVFSIGLNRQIRSANIGTMPLSSCLQLPDANTLIVGCWDNTIKIYDLDFGRITQNVQAHKDAVTCISWGNKVNLLGTGSSDCTVRVWKGFNNNGMIKPMECLICQLDHNSEVTCLNFDPDNTRLAVGTEDGEVYVWKLFEQNLDKRFPIHRAAVKALSYSPDGQKLVSCSTDKSFQILDIKTGMSLYSKLLEAPLHCLKWDDFMLLLGDEEGQLYIWNIIEVRLMYQVKAHIGPINTVDVSQNKKFVATGGEDQQINIWQPVK